MKSYQKLSAQEQLAYRKKREIWSKLGALASEFDSWLARSTDGKLFQKHHTQIRAVKAHLGLWSKTVRLMVKRNLREDADVFLESIYNAEKLILSEHRIWEYFRSKLIQRDEESFHRYLKVADEFAWACYRPIQQYIYPDPVHALRKEPPLVFFNGGMSPFSASRGKDFQPEKVEMPGEALSAKEIAVINKLPIPVVGIPWHQINHLPEAVVIGHEVGHIVEDDFGLTEQLKVLLLEALAEAKAAPRQEAWCNWLGEIFADIYGCLSAGPAFAGALIDFLARDYGEISVELKTGEDTYPTIYLRGLILLKTLEEMGFDEETRRYRKLWENFSSRMAAEFTSDISFIVPKILHGKLIKHDTPDAAKSIMEVFKFSDEQQTEVSHTLKELGLGMTPSSRDIRVLFASVRAAYEADPKEFIRKDYCNKILALIENQVIRSGIRRNEVPLNDTQIKEKIEEYERSAREMIEDFLKQANA